MGSRRRRRRHNKANVESDLLIFALGCRRPRRPISISGGAADFNLAAESESETGKGAAGRGGARKHSARAHTHTRKTDRRARKRKRPCKWTRNGRESRSGRRLSYLLAEARVLTLVTCAAALDLRPIINLSPQRFRGLSLVCGAVVAARARRNGGGDGGGDSLVGRSTCG